MATPKVPKIPTLSEQFPGRLPDPPALPDGNRDCDADPGGKIFAELEEFSLGLPEVLAARRRRAAAQQESEDSAAAIAAAAERARIKVRGKTHASRVTPKSPTPKQKRLLRVHAALSKAPAGASNRELGEYYDRAGLSPPKAWGVRTYAEVWGNKKLESKFRKEKSEARKLN